MKVIEPAIPENVIDYIKIAVDSKQLSQGPLVEKFEIELAKYLGVKPENVVVVSSGTAALHLAYLLTSQNRLTISASTFISMGNMGKLANKRLEIIDVNEKTWVSNTADVSVDLFGNPVLHEPLIEDAAQALGSKRSNGQKCGTLGKISILSFFENKILTTGGEGGALVCKERINADMARLMRQHGKDYTMVTHELFGFNYRMTEVQAAFGLAQLPYIDSYVKRKREVWKTYYEELQSYATFQEEIGYSNRWATVILLQKDKRAKLIKALDKERIPWRSTFKPLDAFQWLSQYKTQSFLPVSMRIWTEGVCLPCSITLEPSYINSVCKVVKRCC